MKETMTFSDLFESSPDAIIIVNQDLMIEKANSRVNEIFVYAKNELEGKKINLLVPDEDRNLHSKFLFENLKTPNRKEMGENRNIYGIKKDSSKVPLEITLNPLFVNGKRKIIAVLRDITKRKEYEQKLKTSELQYKNLILNHPHGILETLLDGTITNTNKAYAKMYGLEPELLVGKKAWEISHEEKFRNEIKVFYQKSKDGNLVPKTTIEERKTKNGEIIQLQINWDYQVDSTGKKIGHTIIVTDVTKFKRVENDLLVSQNRLRALSVNLQDKIEAEKKNMALEIHDELGQVLTAVNMEIDYLIDELEENEMKSSQKVIENLHSIGKLIDRLILTVQNISTELRPDIIDHLGLYAAIEWQLNEFEKRFKIKTKINNFVENLILSEEKTISIYRIFQETLTNIARHSEAKTVNVNFELIDETLEISITDDGIGIDKEILNDIKSIGILGIMERVHILGGEISIQNAARGVGTEVLVKVPLNKQEQV
jgi:two-component system sensor histidine kinase UhpB